MRINPQQKLKNKLFYNNICIIVCLFCIICFLTVLFFQDSKVAEKTYYNLKEESVIGPVVIKNKSQIYKIIAYFKGNNQSTYISGEVLDENKDTLYEFGKDLWHEEGYDSEGYWSEAVRTMAADLTFSKKGTYFIQFRTDENSLDQITITFQLKKGSYIAHLQVGVIFFLVMFIVWYFINRDWIKEKMILLNDKLEEMSDD